MLFRKIVNRLSETLSEHLSGAKPIKALSYRCAAPSHFFSSSLPTNKMQALRECGTVVTYSNVKENVFEACSLEAVEKSGFPTEPLNQSWHIYFSTSTRVK